MTQLNPALDSALHLLTLGMALIPVPRGSKGPKAAGWNAPENHVTTPNQARRVFRYPSNIGVMLGSSRLLSLDVDHLEAARQELAGRGIDLAALMDAHPHPIAARGTRYWYTLPEDVDLVGVRARKAQWEGQQVTAFELRAGDGAQDIAPGSLHPDGMEYVWSRGAPLTRADLPEAPLPLLKLYDDWWERPERAQSVVPQAVPASRASGRIVLPPLRSVAGLAPAEDTGQRLDVEAVRRWMKANYTVPQILARYGVRANSSGKVRCIAPAHLDHEPSMSVQMDYCHCHACKASFDVLKLLEHYEGLTFRQAALELGYQPEPQEQTVSATSRPGATPDVEQCHGVLAVGACRAVLEGKTETARAAAAYLQGRGFTREDVDRFTLGVIDETVTALPLTRIGRTGPDWQAKWRDCVTIPDIRASGLVALKARQLDPQASDGDKYRTAPGTGRLEPFNLLAWVDRRVDDPLLLVEGELDCLSVMAACPDLPVAGLPGVNNLRAPHVTALAGRRVTVLLDPDVELERTAIGDRSWMTLQQMQEAELPPTVRAGRYVIDILVAAGVDVRCVPAMVQGDVNDAFRVLGREAFARALHDHLRGAMVPALPSGRPPLVRRSRAS